MECVTPSKAWPPTDSLASGPHHSTPQRLQNSVMATPESMPISSPDPQALNMSMDKSLTETTKLCHGHSRIHAHQLTRPPSPQHVDGQVFDRDYKTLSWPLQNPCPSAHPTPKPSTCR